LPLRGNNSTHPLVRVCNPARAGLQPARFVCADVFAALVTIQDPMIELDTYQFAKAYVVIDFARRFQLIKLKPASLRRVARCSSPRFVKNWWPW